MKIRADEHLSPKIVAAIRSLVLSPDWELSHVRDDNAARTADETWIPRFVQEGGKAILSADRHILARPHQIKAIADGGLIGVFLDRKWAESRRNVQAALILWWWPTIEATVLWSAPTQCWRVPAEFGGQISPINVNYVAARAALDPDAEKS